MNGPNDAGGVQGPVRGGPVNVRGGPINSTSYGPIRGGPGQPVRGGPPGARGLTFSTGVPIRGPLPPGQQGQPGNLQQGQPGNPQQGGFYQQQGQPGQPGPGSPNQGHALGPLRGSRGIPPRSMSVPAVQNQQFNSPQSNGQTNYNAVRKAVVSAAPGHFPAMDGAVLSQMAQQEAEIGLSESPVSPKPIHAMGRGRGMGPGGPGQGLRGSGGPSPGGQRGNGMMPMGPARGMGPGGPGNRGMLPGAGGVRGIGPGGPGGRGLRGSGPGPRGGMGPGAPGNRGIGGPAMIRGGQQFVPDPVADGGYCEFPSDYVASDASAQAHAQQPYNESPNVVETQPFYLPQPTPETTPHYNNYEQETGNYNNYNNQHHNTEPQSYNENTQYGEQPYNETQSYDNNQNYNTEVQNNHWGEYGLNLTEGAVAPLGNEIYETNPNEYGAAEDSYRGETESITIPDITGTLGDDDEGEPTGQKQDDYNEPEDHTNCTYNAETGELKAATYPQLIAKLCSNTNSIDIEDFLLTYRSFCKPEQLLQSLFQRYHTAPPESVRNIHLRVFNIMSKWIENFWFDFETDPNCTSLAQEFLSQIQADQRPENKGDVTVAKSVAQRLERKIQNREKDKIVATQVCPTPVTEGKDPRMLTLLDCHELEVARQITILTWDVWHAIKPWECLGLAWTKKGGKAQHIEEMTRNFNYMSGWVTTTILVTPTLRGRVKFIKKFLDIAYHLRALGNFNGVMEILSGLNRQPVFRMVKTFAEVQRETKYKTLFQELSTLTSHDRAYANLRAAIQATNPPVIPYLGMYLSDMVFIEEGNPTKITLGDKTLYNFFKCRSIAAAIKKIQQYQPIGYALERLESIQVKLKRQVILELEADMYAISSFHEPREGKEPGPKPQALTDFEATVAKKLQEIRDRNAQQQAQQSALPGGGAGLKPKKPRYSSVLKEKDSISKRKSKDKLTKEEVQLLDLLCTACWDGNTSNFKVILNNPALPPIINLPSSKGTTPLYCACRQGHSDLVIDLLNTGFVDINVQLVEHGGTAMHAAAFGGRGECLALLIAMNGDKTIKNKKGLTPLQDAHMTVMDIFTLQGFRDLAALYPKLNKLTNPKLQ